MIRYYFQLQFKMTLRKIREFGMHPILAFLLFAIAGIILHYTLLTKLNYSDWIVFLVPILILFSFSNPKKLEFLLIHLNKKSFYGIRILENTIISLAPVIYLLWNHSFGKGMILLLITIVVSFFSFQIKSQKVFPTPFTRFLYEYAIGFRKTVLIYPLSFLILILSFKTGNHYIGVFAWLVLMFTTLSYYSYPDDEFYIWNSRLSVRGFLFNKIFQGLYYTTMISIPFFIVFLFFTEVEIIILIVLQFVIFLLQISILLSKYASHPRMIHIPYSILTIVCILFPPMFLFFIPYLFTKAKNKLIPYLQ